MQIQTTLEFKRALRAGPYAWPGGYPLFFICDDGGALCSACAKRDAKLVMGAIRDSRTNGWPARGWLVVGQAINWEDNSMFCDGCNEQIESAYGDDQ